MRKKNHIEIVAGLKDKGKRIDIFISEHDIDISRSRIQKLIKSGRIKVSGLENISKSYILDGTERIILSNIDSFDEEIMYSPQKIDINIIYEDDYMLAVSKPPGMVVHPAPGNRDNTLLNAVLYYNDSIGFDKGARAGIVHRLDKDTSGIILIAKDLFSHNRLSLLFKDRKIKKTYIALVLGNFKEKTGLIDIPISRSKKNRKMMDVSVSGRRSETEFKVLKTYESCSLIEVCPKTGRTHQIRVHFSHIGHPVIGDKTYGNKETKLIAGNIGLERHFLHASRITFIHPFTDKIIDIKDEMPEDLKNSLELIK
ncbi:MAG: RluA family pseudouridine synthase [Actinomycetota bacterium]|nr:RluA family pseudouridine synthase [Actinomycetota bacterium]